MLQRWIIIWTCLLGVISCNSPDDPAIRFGLSAAPQNLDPRFATDATSSRINRLLYRQLIKFDDAYQPQPDLATWEVRSPTHYRFTLQTHGRQFHHGQKLIAEDVAQTYRFVLQEKNGSPHRGALHQRIDRIEVLDEETLDFYLKTADPLFPAYLGVGILPRDLMAAKHPFAQTPVGSGPYQLISWPKAGRLRLQRIADKQALVFIKTKDPSVRVLKLIRGEIDVLQNELPKELVGYLKQQPGIQVQPSLGANFSYIGFNLTDPSTGQLEVRQAIAYALDRDVIIKYILNGAARPANAFFPADHWAANPALKKYPHNPEKAKMLLKSIGYDAEHPLTLTYKTSTNPLRVRIATVIQNQLADVGIQVDVRTYDWGTFYADIKSGNFQMYSLSWVGIKTPDIFQYVFASEFTPDNNGANRGRYHNPQVDALIEHAAKGDTLAKQAIDYRAIQAILLQDLPYVPLWYEDHFYAARDNISAYSIPRDGNYDGLQHIVKQ